jgi:DNA-binding response OmpR family regulator
MARILVADDDEQAIEIVRAALEERGHIVGALNDGTGVANVVEFKKPDLVILDCSMPAMSGVDALRAIRKSLTVFDTPVLMLTARKSESDEKIARFAGADDYVRKPIDPDWLVMRVEALLEKSRQQGRLNS